MHRTNDISGSTIWIRPRSGALSPKIRSVIGVASDESSRLCKDRRNCCAGSVDVVAFGSRYLFWADATPSKWAELNGLPPKDGLLGVSTMSFAVAGPNGPLIAPPNMIGESYRLREGAIPLSFLDRFRSYRFRLSRTSPSMRDR